jgi:hypothetical protein
MECVLSRKAYGKERFRPMRHEKVYVLSCGQRHSVRLRWHNWPGSHVTTRAHAQSSQRCRDRENVSCETPQRLAEIRHFSKQRSSQPVPALALSRAWRSCRLTPHCLLTGLRQGVPTRCVLGCDLRIEALRCFCFVCVVSKSLYSLADVAIEAAHIWKGLWPGLSYGLGLERIENNVLLFE